LAIAEANGITDLVVPCAACYSRLTVTNHELTKDPQLKNKINDILEMDYSGKVNVINVIEWIDRFLIDKIEEKIKKPFNYNVACYYGCLLVRPPKVLNYDRVEDPQTMDIVMNKLGAHAIDFPFKTECCGAGFSVSRTDIVSKLSGKIIKDATLRQADAIIVACPMCHSNLDMRRPDINKALSETYNIPIIYITQAMGLAVGLTEEQVGLNRHFVKVNLPKVNVTSN
jgi:heterodisulfide reductase subunit B